MTKLEQLGWRVVLTAALIAGLTTFAGCTTTPTGQRVPDVGAMTFTAQSASYVGARMWLREHPEDRSAFERSRDGLKILIAAGTFSAQDLTVALQKLPIRELRSDEGAVIVDVAVVLWDNYGRQLADLDKARVFDTYILPVAKAIYKGLDQALTTDTAAK
jgi:hypothetical protein